MVVVGKGALFGELLSLIFVSEVAEKEHSTVKFLNFGTPEIITVIYLKFKQNAKPKGILSKHANGIANSEDPDQTAPLGAV